MTIAITGASGTLGRLISERLEDAVLVTRDPSAVEGADVREGDFDDPASLERAFAGVDRLLIISLPRVGERVPLHRAAIDAAAAAGVGHVLYTSITDPSDSNPAYVAAEHRATEDHMRASGLAWTFLRNSIYTEMLVPTAQGALAGGTLLTNIGGGATSYVGRADCAAAAVAVLTGEGHEGKAYDITGPEALGADAQAALFSELGGKPVTVTHVDDDAWVAAMVEHAGLPEPAARIYASFGEAARRGYSDTVSAAVHELTGREPIAARDVLRGLL
jgi:NAD(P)H dehydrogenase (quinone)